MGNLGGGEILVILFVALIVLGPTKLPEAARQAGRAVQELRRMSGAFQRELKEAINEPVKETKAIVKDVQSTVTGTIGSTGTGSTSTPPTSTPPTRTDTAPSTEDGNDVADSPPDGPPGSSPA